MPNLSNRGIYSDTSENLKYLLKLLRKFGACKVKFLARKLGVSVSTVRSYLARLIDWFDCPIVHNVKAETYELERPTFKLIPKLQQGM